MFTEVTTVASTAVVTLSLWPIAVWVSIALLAAGYARTRNRSPWAWFVSAVFLGPLAVFCLVVWPAIDPVEAKADEPSPAATRP